MITYVKGNLFESDVNILVHGCNCFHVMGGGVARIVKELYPKAFSADKQFSFRGDIAKLGSFTSATVTHHYTGKELLIINGYTQYEFGGGEDLFNYDAMKELCCKLNGLFKDKSIAMPMIGSGLAGGDWKRIEKIINSEFKDKEVFVYYL